MSNSENSKLWGGRFEGGADETFAEFNRSFGVDRRLLAADLKGSIAHCEGLRKAGVLSDSEAAQIKAALDSMLSESSDERIFDGSAAEDVHSFIESRLISMIGDTGRKIHTGRSRNDQVSTAFRIWVKEELGAMDRELHRLQTGLIGFAERHRDAVIPGYTHMQRAQPVLFAHWCLAYFEMLRRDRERLSDAARRVDVMPLGSGAIAGSGYPVDRESVARDLGFSGVTRNSLDAVSDRDFAIESVGALSLIMVHLSRIAEDLIIYSTHEFGFIVLGDAVSTGSSLMPQKKNPDALELVRGKAGRVFGHQAALLTMMKGLPLAYNKDMQEDKEAVFDAFDTVRGAVRVAEIVLRNVTLDESRALASAMTGFLNATELADYLVRKGLPFRTAHDLVGRIVVHCISQGCELGNLTLEAFKSFSELFEEDVIDALSIGKTLASKAAKGGTSPARVAEALAEAKEYIASKG